MSMETRPGVKVNLSCDRCGKTYMRPAITIRPDSKSLYCSKGCMKKTDEERDETKKACRKRWDDANRVHVRQRAKEWRLKNPERVKELKRQGWIRNKEKYSERAKEYRAANYERIRKREKEALANNPIKNRENAKRWADNNREWVRERGNRHRQANRASYMFYRVKKECKRIGIECDMTEEWFQSRIDSGVCEMSGIPFDMAGKRTPNSPSVDRIVPGGPYTMANCRLILWSINRALSNYGEEYILGIFTSILEKRKCVVGGRYNVGGTLEK